MCSSRKTVLLEYREVAITAEITSIARHRIGVDGYGVVTLVVMKGCPLRCRYCLNRHALDGKSVSFTPEKLLERVAVDNLYYLASGGGITFGGGEPLLNADFIRSFSDMCNPEWSINVETSLNIPIENLKLVADAVDLFIIDIKDMNNDVYRSYTGKDNDRVIENLKYLSDNGFARKCLIRIPQIPAFNTGKDTGHSKKILEELGFTRFNDFIYRVEES